MIQRLPTNPQGEIVESSDANGDDGGCDGSNGGQKVGGGGRRDDGKSHGRMGGDGDDEIGDGVGGGAHVRPWSRQQRCRAEAPRRLQQARRC